MDLTWRPVAVADIPALAALTNVLAEVDGTGEFVTEEALAESAQSPRFDLRRDTVSAWDAGRLVAYGNVFTRDDLVEGRALTFLSGAVDPTARRQGIGTKLHRWLEQRGIELAGDRFPGAPIRLRAAGGLAGSAAQVLLESFGYRPDNYFITMEAELESWTDPGDALRSVQPDHELLLATREAHNDAFRDHRNAGDYAQDRWEHWIGSSAMRAVHSRVVVEGSRVLSYALSTQYRPEVLHVALVGTRRQARGQGLGRDVLTGVLRGARGAFRVAELEVDSTSPTGADRLYRSVGMQPVRTLSRYVRDVD